METASVVAVFESHDQADAAVAELQQAGIDMTKISIVGKDYHTGERIVGYYNAGDRMKYWGKSGAFWGGLWGLLVGAGFFAVPGIGPVLIAGPFVAFVVSALEGAIVLGGLSVVGASLEALAKLESGLMALPASQRAEEAPGSRPN